MKTAVYTLALVVLCACSDCTSTKIKHGDWELDRVSWLQKMEIKTITVGTNTFTIEGYMTDGGTQMAVIVLDATGKIISNTAAKALVP